MEQELGGVVVGEAGGRGGRHIVPFYCVMGVSL